MVYKAVESVPIYGAVNLNIIILTKLSISLYYEINVINRVDLEVHPVIEYRAILFK